METVLQVALSNAAAATVLSLAAAVAARLLRRPPLTRALWLLVLLKLLTPPLWTIHVPVPHAASTQAPVTRAIPSKAPDVVAAAPAAPIAGPGERVIDHVPQDVMQEVGRLQSLPAAPPVVQNEAVPRVRSWIEQSWPLLVTIVWLSGSCFYTLLVVRSELRLRRLVRRSRPAPRNVTLRCGELAGRLGLRRLPEVRFLNRSITPMLCGIVWRPRLLMPTVLWDNLTDGQRDSVLAHELAHLRRGDHQVRLFELLVTVLYWWLPIIWWARRELREATEQCCDAWVLWTIPRSQRNYATALIEAIDYLSTAQARVPLSATGMGQFTNLKRRLVMINRGTVRRTLSWPALAGVCAAAALLLPLSPTIAQTDSSTTAAANQDNTPALSNTQATTAAPALSNTQVTTGTPANESVALTGAADNELPTAHSDRSQIETARADVEELRAKLEAAEARLALLEHGNKAGGGRFGAAYGQAGHNGNNYVTTTPQNLVYGAGGRGSRFGGEGGGVGTGYATGGRGSGFGGGGLSGGSGYPGAAGQALNAVRPTAEQRLEMLEEQFQQFQRELHELRQQMHPDETSGLQKR